MMTPPRTRRLPPPPPRLSQKSVFDTCAVAYARARAYNGPARRGGHRIGFYRTLIGGLQWRIGPMGGDMDGVLERHVRVDRNGASSGFNGNIDTLAISKR